MPIGQNTGKSIAGQDSLEGLITRLRTLEYYLSGGGIPPREKVTSALTEAADKLTMLKDALAEVRMLFDDKGYLFTSGDHQLEVIRRIDAILAGKVEA